MELHTVDHPFIDRQRQCPRRLVEARSHMRERVAVVAITALDRVGNMLERIHRRRSELGRQRLPDGFFRELSGPDDDHTVDVVR